MAELTNLRVVVELTNRTIPITRIQDNVTAQELLSQLASKINLPAGTTGVLKRKITQTQILPNQTLRSAGVESGETLIADFERTAG